MNSDEIKQQVKEMIPCTEYLHKAPRGNYCCPFCGSGTGANGSGALTYYKNSNTWNCFSCGKSGDVIDLEMRSSGTDYSAALKALASRAGIDDGGSRPGSWKPQEKKPLITARTREDPPAPDPDFTAYYEQCRKKLQGSGEAADYLSRRGISMNTAVRYGLGYDEAADPAAAPGGIGSKKHPCPRLIIPTGKRHYVGRAIDDRKDFEKINAKGTHPDIFNVEALQSGTPVFITEGVFDALSVSEMGYNAVATCSTANTKKLLQLIDDGQSPKGPLIIAMDNDDPGRKAAAALKDELTKRGIFSLMADTEALYNGQKDANAALTYDRKSFRDGLEKAVRAASGPAAPDNTVSDRAVERDDNMISSGNKSASPAAGSIPAPKDAAKEIRLSKDEEQERQREEAYRNSCTKRHIQEFINGIMGSVNTPVISTGFSNFDKLLDGGLYEGLYIIGGITSAGKTSFVLQMADNIAAGGQDVLYISLEMARSELMARSFSRHTAQLDIKTTGSLFEAKTCRDITDGKRYAGYSESEALLIRDAINEYSEYSEHIFILEPEKRPRPDDISDDIKRHIKLYGKAPVVFVDYMQILEPKYPHGTDKANMDYAVMRLKQISRKYKIPVIAISSFNRSSYNKDVAMDAFKESGGIEYSADVLLGLQYPGQGTKSLEEIKIEKKKNPREIEIAILKQRNGISDENAFFFYYPQFNLFTERGENDKRDSQGQEYKKSQGYLKPKKPKIYGE